MPKKYVMVKDAFGKKLSEEKFFAMLKASRCVQSLLDVPMLFHPV